MVWWLLPAVSGSKHRAHWTPVPGAGPRETRFLYLQNLVGRDTPCLARRVSLIIPVFVQITLLSHRGADIMAYVAVCFAYKLVTLASLSQPVVPHAWLHGRVPHSIPRYVMTRVNQLCFISLPLDVWARCGRQMCFCCYSTATVLLAVLSFPSCYCLWRSVTHWFLRVPLCSN